MANVYCGACGRIIDIEDVFCVFCGKKRKNEIKADIEDLDLEQPLNLSSFLEEKKDAADFLAKRTTKTRESRAPFLVHLRVSNVEMILLRLISVW